MAPCSMWWPPTQTMPTETRFITSESAGIIVTMARVVNSWVFIKSRLASSKRSRSSSCLPKALITEMPVRISLDTRLSLSTRVCMILNLGMVSASRARTTVKTATTARAMTQPMEALVCTTMKMPPRARMGA